jgi:integrase
MHRAIHPREEIPGAFVIRHGATRNDQVIMPPGRNARSPKGRIISRSPAGPTERITKRVAQATQLAALGKTHAEIATALGIKESHIVDWQMRHSDLWRAGYDRAMSTVKNLVLAQAGTDTVLSDPASFIAMAAACDRWSKQRGESLFPERDGLTLRQFYETHYRLTCLPDGKPRTVELHRHALRRWSFLTGDPAIPDITTEMLVKFRDCLLKLHGKHLGTGMSANTVRKDLKVIETVLTKAGPPGLRNRDAAGLINRVPWIRPPKFIYRQPRFVDPEQLNAVYHAAVAMELPRIAGFKAPAWWRALIVVAYNTGLRRNSLLSLRMEDVNWVDRYLNVRAEITKTAQAQVLPFNHTVQGHLLSIRTDRSLVFPWPHHERWFHKQFHRLQQAAGIPSKEHFGLHDLRKTAATLLWEMVPAAAQLMLGHTSPQTTRKHYVNRQGILARAVEQMPQPPAFAGKGGAA